MRKLRAGRALSLGRSNELLVSFLGSATCIPPPRAARWLGQAVSLRLPSVAYQIFQVTGVVGRRMVRLGLPKLSGTGFLRPYLYGFEQAGEALFVSEPASQAL